MALHFNVNKYMTRARQFADAGAAKYGGKRADYMDAAKKMAMQEFKNEAVYSVTAKNDIITVAGKPLDDNIPNNIKEDTTQDRELYYQMVILQLLSVLENRIPLSDIKEGAEASYTLWHYMITQSGEKNGWELTYNYLKHIFPDLESDMSAIIFAEYTGSGYSRKEAGSVRYQAKVANFVSLSDVTGYEPFLYFLR